jgi:retinitis pigmentosa 9 protein
MYEPPPGLYDKEPEEKPEDYIPDTPQNAAAREFLKKAPTKGLWYGMK